MPGRIRPGILDYCGINHGTQSSAGISPRSLLKTEVEEIYKLQGDIPCNDIFFPV